MIKNLRLSLALLAFAILGFSAPAFAGQVPSGPGKIYMEGKSAFVSWDHQYQFTIKLDAANYKNGGGACTQEGLQGISGGAEILKLQTLADFLSSHPAPYTIGFQDCLTGTGKWNGLLRVCSGSGCSGYYYAIEDRYVRVANADWTPGNTIPRGLARVPAKAIVKHVPLPPSRPTEIATTITPAPKLAPVPAKVVAPLPAPAPQQPVQLAEPAKPVAPAPVTVPQAAPAPVAPPPSVVFNLTLTPTQTQTNNQSLQAPATVPAVQSPPVPQPAPATTASITPPAKPAPTLIPPTAESDFGGGIGVEPVPKQ